MPLPSNDCNRTKIFVRDRRQDPLLLTPPVLKESTDPLNMSHTSILPVPGVSLP